MTRIYLIGMPGSGKSAVGRKLAEILQLPFVDLDAEIEKAEGMQISRIFEEFGEARFRKVESETLRAWASRADAFIMATGGGAPCFHKGIDIINESGTAIYLDVPANELASRIAAEAHRPLIRDSDREVTLIRLLENRRSTYEQAKYRIDAAQAPDEVATAIMKVLKSHPEG